MIGVLVVSHCGIADELLLAVEQITGEVEGVESISIDITEPPEVIRERIKRGIKNVDRGKGVLILTDMFGGTPSNVSLSFLERGKVEVVTGVNLPMLLKVVSLREEMPLEELATYIANYGKNNINVASQVLQRKAEVVRP
ncbi:MAG: PTS fructose transporter subunit IIA [Deltaproteobacteria bacterium]|nr:MAG: PTS fructose transporter subunit IIA [Deltaproteobacteria bacterium]